MVISPEESGLKEARDEENTIITSDSMLCKILPSHPKKISAWYKVMYGCKCCKSARSVN